MADSRLCPHCQAWAPCPEDAWCAHCGSAVARLALSLQPDVLQIRNIAPPLNATLTNHSCAELNVQQTVLPDWVTVSGLPPTLAPGATVRFTAKARTLGLVSPETASLSIVTSAGEARALLLMIEEVPTLETAPAELELWGDSPRTHRLLIFPRAGALRIRSVGRAALHGSGSEPFFHLADPPLTSHAHPMHLSLTLDDGRLRTHTVSALEVTYDGPFGTRVAPLALKLVPREPPQLRWTGENDAPAELFASTGQRLEVRIANQAADGRDSGARNAGLCLEAAHLSGSGSPGVPGIRLLTPLPLTLRGGESGLLTFELDLDTQPAGERSGGAQPLLLRLQLVADALTLERPVAVRVRPLPVFDGVLAIDFGSSNTCAALVETGRETEMLALDGQGEITPTLLRYDRLDGPVPQVETGERIERLAVTDDRSAAGTLAGLKQRLGDDRQELAVRPYRETEWTTRTATAAAADYLREVRRIVEANRHAIFHDFILTHPAVCSLQQYRNLRTALVAAFGETPSARIRFLQEPIAALIPFFAARAALKPTAPHYTVASFDLGGGTTDLAIVRVEHSSPAPGRLEMRPGILFSRGIRFGGEDLTAFLVERMSSAADGLVAASRPGAVLIREGTPGSAREDALRNQFALRSAAEQFKASLSDEGRVPAGPDALTLLLRILQHGKEAAEDFSIPMQELTSAQGKAPDKSQDKAQGLKASFLAEVAERVRGMAEMLAEAEAHTSPLEYIQLSGKTSYLPAVGEVLRERFPRARVSRAGNPKECVVTGACLLRALSRRPAQRLVLPDAASRTTSAIGLYDPQGPAFTTILPVDTAIPAGGLAGEWPFGWFGSEPVALFENLGVSDRELAENGGGSRLLRKLGTWTAEAARPEAEAEGWTLRLLLKDFELELSAVGAQGQTVAFHRRGDATAAGSGRPAGEVPR